MFAVVRLKLWDNLRSLVVVMWKICVGQTCNRMRKPTFLCLRLSYVYNVLVERRSRVVM
jgi:hypothetical protein